MPQIATVSANDSTSVSHVFTPNGATGGVGTFANRAPGVPALFDTLRVEMSPPQGNRSVYRFKLGMYNPIEDSVVDGKVGRYNSVDLTINLSPESTEAERQDTLVLLKNLLGTSLIDDVVQYAESLY